MKTTDTQSLFSISKYLISAFELRASESIGLWNLTYLFFTNIVCT